MPTFAENGLDFDLTRATIGPTPGWPKDGEPGEWIGWDAQGRVSLLRWWSVHDDAKRGTWMGVRFDPSHTDSNGQYWPMCFLRGPDTESFVIVHRSANAARED